MSGEKYKRPMATEGAGYWTLTKDIAKRWTTFERKVSRRMFRGIKIHKN
jgi:hypothetical protein